MIDPDAVDLKWMALALREARKGIGKTSPNPRVGAVLVDGLGLLGKGWHRAAGGPHAEIHALEDAVRRGNSARLRGATLYVTLEPCSTQGRTPPCTEAVIRAGVSRVVVAAQDPNPRHAGRGFDLLRHAGIRVESGLLAEESSRLNEGFEHWMRHQKPFVTLKAAMTLDGKIATAAGESKWITGEASRQWAMRLRQSHDAILVGAETVALDNPSLTCRGPGKAAETCPWRVILDPSCRLDPGLKVFMDGFAHRTLLVTSEDAEEPRVSVMKSKVHVMAAPLQEGRIRLDWLLKRLGEWPMLSVLVEGGGEVQGEFLRQGLVQRTAFFYAPLVLGGAETRKAVAGPDFGLPPWQLEKVEWKTLGEDLFMTGLVGQRREAR